MVRKQGAVLAAVDEVLLDQEVVAAFIRVDSPATVVPSRDIMHQVVTDASAGRAAGVNAGQIAEHALADVMHVIVFDDIARGLARPEILDRAHGDARVEQVVNVVVNDLVVGIVAHEHAHRFRSKPPAVGDLVVGHRDPPAVRALRHGGLALASPLGQLAGPVRLPREKVADPDSPRADIRDPVARDLDVRAAHVHLDAVVADMFDAAVGDGASFGVIKQAARRALRFRPGATRHSRPAAAIPYAQR